MFMLLKCIDNGTIGNVKTSAYPRRQKSKKNFVDLTCEPNVTSWTYIPQAFLHRFAATCTSRAELSFLDPRRFLGVLLDQDWPVRSVSSPVQLSMVPVLVSVRRELEPFRRFFVSSRLRFTRSTWLPSGWVNRSCCVHVSGRASLSQSQNYKRSSKYLSFALFCSKNRSPVTSSFKLRVLSFRSGCLCGSRCTRSPRVTFWSPPKYESVK